MVQVIGIKITTILILLLQYCQCFLDYSQEHTLSCQNIPVNTPLRQVLPSMWNISILHQLDRITFLVLCPVIFIFQLLIAFSFWKFPSLFNKPGDIFFGILLSQIGLNLHLLVTAIYYTINSVNKSMPDSFISFCSTLAILQSFFFNMQLFYMFFFLIWAMYTVKTSLKQRKFLLGIGVHVMIILIAIGVTIFYWFDQFLGLNNEGLCAITAVRKKQASIALPAISIFVSLLFIILGIYSWNYFRTNMPKVQGLQRRRYYQNKLISLYVGGVSIFLTLYSVIGLTMYINCFLDSPEPLLTVWASVQSYLILAEYCFFLGLILKNRLIRKKLKKSIRSLCQKQSDWKAQIQLSHRFQQTDMGQFGLNSKVLELKQQEQTIDMLRVAQVISVLAGIFISHAQYMKKFAIQQDVQFDIKKIYLNETISFQLGPQVLTDYKIETQILPKIGILDGTMTIHAPRIFKRLIMSDGLLNIDKSFDLFKNYEKIYNLIEGQGGKSGEFFFFSYDNKYVLKTITTDQFQFILENLGKFAQYYQNNPHSLLAKIYGVYSIKGKQLQHMFHLILMKNILGCKKNQVIRTYDMKGSKHDRQVIKAQKKYKYNELTIITLKDTDFIKLQGKLNIPRNIVSQFRKILRKDSDFLKQLNLIDYSLLVVRINWPSSSKFLSNVSDVAESRQMAQRVTELFQERTLSARQLQIKRELSSLSAMHLKLGSQNYTGFHKFQQIQSTEEPDEYYHIGIIDYMQKWDLQKKGQKWWKTFIGKKQVSAEEPNKYQQRFMAFVDEITYKQFFSDINQSKQSSDSSSNSSRVVKSDDNKSKQLNDIQEVKQES